MASSKNTPLLKGTLELLTLKIIALQPSSTSDVRATLQEKFKGSSAGRGSLGPVFAGLVRNRLITPANAPRARKNAVKYMLTTEGKNRMVELSQYWVRCSSAVNELVSAEISLDAKRRSRIKEIRDRAKWELPKWHDHSA